MDIIKKSELQSFFDNILKSLNKNKIEKICSEDDFGSINNYSIDKPLIIIFENKYALFIEYPFIDSLSIEYRKLSNEEKTKYAGIDVHDFFNRTNEIYNSNNWKLSRRESIRFDYNIIDKFEIRNVIGIYDVWDNNNIISKEPTKETFDKITIILNNGKKINICPEDAIFDGYLNVWADGVDYKKNEY